jgi:CHAT domain-containing protein/tetratricopeptide (TPR) repeat protein
LEGGLAGAKEAWSAALQLVERTLGSDHADVVSLLSSLSLVARQEGDTRAARTLLDRAVGISHQSLAPCHPQTASVQSNLGQLLTYTGQFQEARESYERALAGFERCLGAAHSLTVTVVHNAANLAAEMGDYARAEQLHRRAVRAWSTTLGPEHPYVARGVDALAGVVAARGRGPEARTLLTRALTIRRKALGGDHPDVAGTLISLSRINAASGRLSLAVRQAEEASAIYERGARPQEPDYLASAMVLLGDLENRRGNLAAARDHFMRARGLREELFGDNHPLTAEAVARMAAADFAAGKHGDAMMSALDAERVGREHLRFTIRYLPERQALAYAAKRPRGLDLALSIAASGYADHVPALLDAVIRSRGVVMDESAARARLAVSADAAVATLAAAVTAARQRFASVMLRSLGGESVSRAELDEARQHKEDAERQLAERSVESRAEASRATAGLNELRAILPAQVALVSFVRFDRTAEAREGGRIVQRESPSYAALVTSTDGVIRMVRLGSAAAVDKAVEDWRREASGRSMAGAVGSGAAERAYRLAGSRLRRLVWDPLTPFLERAAQVFVVPDGALNLVSFAALPTAIGRYLVETGPIVHLLSTERDLIRTEGESRGLGLLAVGGAAYDHRPRSVARAVRRGAGCADQMLGRFEDLPGSRTEVQDIARIWRAQTALQAAPADDVLLLSGADAVEEAVIRTAAGKRVVHFSTHGFVLGAGCEPAAATSRSVGGLTGAGRRPRTPAAGDADNALLMAGLALAGANRRASALSGSNDGIMTAEEVLGLNLQGTEWAVLSACDTGLGHIRAGEGVFGLRRAFQIAGAHSVIMSLWSVEDRATGVWMRALYEARFREGLSTAEAIHKTDLRVLQRRRARGLSTHPFYWGAFVGAGDWR